MDKHLKKDLLLVNKYYRRFRYPFNIIYWILLYGGIAFSLIITFKEVTNNVNTWYVPVMFLLFFIIIWVGVIYIVRWIHLDSKVMYKIFEHVDLYKHKMVSSYKLMFSFIHSSAQEHILFGNIKSLCLITDTKTDLQILEVELKELEIKFMEDESENRSNIRANKVKTLNYPDATRYIPLYFKENEYLLDYLKKQSNLPITTKTMNFNNIVQKRK